MLKIILEYKDTYSTEIYKEEDKGYYSSLDTEKWPYSLGYIIREYTNYIDKTEPNSLDIFSENKHLHINYKGHSLSILQCLPKEDSFINYLTNTKFIPKRKLHNVIEQFMQFVDKEEKLKYIDKNINANLVVGKTLLTKIMKINFTFGDTVTINLAQDKEGFYNYTPKNNTTSLVQFFSIKDAILFFSEFLPVKVYDKEDSSLTFVVNIEYKNVGIAFYMLDEDRTKNGWMDRSTGFSNFLKVNKKVDDSIDDTIKHFINFVDKEEEDSDLSINGKTYLIKYEEENKEYSVMFTPFLRITGKSIEEVKEKIKEIYWAFGVDN